MLQELTQMYHSLQQLEADLALQQLLQFLDYLDLLPLQDQDILMEITLDFR